MAEEFKVLLGVELDTSAADTKLNALKTSIQGLGHTNPIRLTMDSSNVTSQINAIRQQLQSLSNININIGGRGGSGGGIQRTVNEVNRAYSDLMNLQRRINSIRIQIGGLDASKNGGQINALSGQLNRLMADYNNLYQTFNRSFSTSQLDSLTNAFDVANGKLSSLDAKMADTSAIKAQEAAYKELLNVSNQINKTELKLGGLKGLGEHTNEITVLENQLQQLRNTYQQLYTASQGSLSTEQMSQLSASVYDTSDKLTQLNAKIADTKAQMASGLIGKFDNSYALDLEKVNVGLDKIKNKSIEVQTAMQQFTTATSDMNLAKQSGDVDRIVASYQNYKQALQNVNLQIRENQRAEKASLDAQKLAQQQTALSSQMDVWLKNNSAAASQFGAKIQALQVELQSCDATRLNGIKAEFQEITRQAELAGKSTQTFGDRLKTQMSKLGTYFSATMLITQSMRAMRDMYNNVHDVDTAMTELYRVTDLSSSQYDTLYSNMVSSAKEYGATLDGIINSTASWVRLGFGANDANKLAEITTMYQHVTDLDESTAVNNLVTAYKGYEEQLLQLTGGDKVAAVEMVADIYDKLGNEFAESAADVGDGLSKSASVLAQGGASIQEAAGMFTGIQEVLQDSATSGTALKILTLRIRGMKGELQELGEDVDENVVNLSKMQGQILNFTHGKVNIFDDEGNFRDIYNIMQEIASIYDTLSDTEKAGLLETIAGKNRANAVQALIDNWDNVEKATEAAYNSAGTAREEQDVWMKSLDGYLAKLSAAWKAFSNDFLSSDFLKGAITGLTGIVNILDKMVKTFGTLGTLAVGNAMFRLFKNGSYFKTLASALADSTLSFSNFGAAAKMALGDLKSFMLTPSGILTGIGLVTAAIGVAVQAYSNYRQKISQERQKEIDEAKSTAEETSNIMSLYGQYQQADAAYKSNTGSKEALTSATSALLSALGYEESEIESLVGKYGSLDDAINNVTMDSLNKAVDEAVQGFNAAFDNVEDAFGNGDDWGANIAKYFGMDNSSVSWLEDTQEFGNKVGKILEDAKLISSGSYNQGGQFYLETDNTEEIIASYEKLLAMRKALKDAMENGDLTKDEYNNSDLVDTIDSQISKFEDTLGDYIEAKDILNKARADKMLFDEFTNNGIPETIDDIDTLKSKMVETAEASGLFEGTADDITTAFENSFNSIASMFPELETLLKGAKSDGVEDFAKATEEQLNGLSERFANGIGKNSGVKQAFEDYKQVVNDFNSLDVDPKQTLFGNIDTNNRQVLEWTKENLATYKDALQSWDDEAKNGWEEYAKNMEGSISTVFGSSAEYDGIEIAFSPMLQTENGAELLTSSTVDNYINGLIEKAGEGWTNEDLLKLDTEGLDIDGKHIQGLIADIGDTAKTTGEAMHFLGKDGAISQAFQGIKNAAKDANMSTDDLMKSMESYEAIQHWFDGLSEDDKQLVYKIGVESDDTTLWTLTKWQEELQSVQETGKTTGEQMQQFYDIINNAEEGSFSETVENYEKKLSSLKDVLSKVDTGQLSESDKVDMVMNFPQLAPYVDDTNALKDAIQDLIDTSNQDINNAIDEQIKALGNNAPEAVVALEALRDAINGLTGTDNWSFNLDDEITKFDNLYKAMKESVSATGLSSQAMQNVKSMFQGLDSYDPSKLFERTYNGIHMNTRELRNLQAEYEKQKKSEINNHLQDLVDDYNNLSKELATCTDAQERATKMTKLNSLQSEISDVADLASQYEGLTSAYNKWIQAQSAGEEGELYDQIREGKEGAKTLYDEGRVGTNAFRTYVDLLSGEDLSTATVDEVVAAYEKLGQTIQGTSYTAMDFVKDGSEGCENFLNAVQELNSDWAKMNSDGSWDINFGRGDDKKIADALGLDVEYVQSILRKLSEYNFDINLDSIFSDMDNLGTYADQANEKLKELGKTDIDFNFNTNSIEEVDSQIEQAQALLDTFKNSDGTVNTSIEGATEAEAVLIGLIARKQELNAPAVMSVDTSQADSNISSTIGLLQNFQSNYNDIEIETAVGVDTSTAQTNIQDVLGQLNSMPDEVKASLGLDDSEFQTALTTLTSTKVDVNAGVNLDTSALDTVQATIAGITPEMMVKAGLDSSLVDGYTPPDKENNVKYGVDDSKVQSYQAPAKTGKVTYTASMNSWTAPTKYGTVIYTVQVKGKAPSNGTANSLGIGLSSGTAFAQGTWGSKTSGVALGGEVGQELVVRNGKFFTIGDDGAEFFQYKKDDIVFNAGQTAQIFKYGKIKNGKKRGEVFAQGNAFVEGTAFSNGHGSFGSGGSGGNRKPSKPSKPSSSHSGGGRSSGGGKSSSSKSEKEFEENLDWIEVALDRIERAIKHLDTTATSVYKTWSTRNNALVKQMGQVSNEIDLQQQAYDRYIQQANSVGLSADWVEKVKNGKIDIEKITDEDLNDKISEFKEWYEKALDCKDAIDELNESLSSLYKQAFDNVSTKFEGILGVIQYQGNMFNEYISQSEEHGYLVSVKYYEALTKNERNNIKQLQKQRDEMLSSLQNAMASGKIAEKSEAWYEMVNAIDEVTLSIEQANTSLIEYGNSIRDIKWSIFDLIQEKISYITKEADFLIKLMDNDKLYDDRGQLTDEGMATMGLHAVDYNTYMQQADMYAKEIKKVSKDLAKDPYNQDLAKRRQELIELQQEMILGAEDEKDAIRDMVSEGIEKELDSLQKLIDKYKDTLDTQKD